MSLTLVAQTIKSLLAVQETWGAAFTFTASFIEKVLLPKKRQIYMCVYTFCIYCVCICNNIYIYIHKNIHIKVYSYQLN